MIHAINERAHTISPVDVYFQFCVDGSNGPSEGCVSGMILSEYIRADCYSMHSKRVSVSRITLFFNSLEGVWVSILSHRLHSLGGYSLSIVMIWEVSFSASSQSSALAVTSCCRSCPAKITSSGDKCIAEIAFWKRLLYSTHSSPSHEVSMKSK